MADRFIQAGTTDVTIMMRLFNATTGAPATGLTIANIDIKIYRLDDDNDVELVQNWTDLTAHAALTDAHTDNYGYEMDSGYYRIDLPDGACQAGIPRGLKTVVLVRTDASTVILETAYTIQLSPPVNMVEIDEDATDGNNATLNLKMLNIVNSGGDAINAESSGGNGNGIHAYGNGSGNGIYGQAGLTGNGIFGLGGGSSGNGLLAIATANNDAGIKATKHGTGVDIDGDLSADALDNISAGGGDVKTIKDNIGTPANIDTGGATLADNLKKIADDNGGGDFDATNHSLKIIRDKVDDVETDTGEIGTAGAGLSDLGGMSTGMKAEVQVEANDALIANNLDHLMKTAVVSNADMTAEVTDGTVLSNIMTKGSDTSDFTVATDSLEGIVDAGLSAVTLASGGLDNISVTDPSGGKATWDFRDWLWWLCRIRFGEKHTISAAVLRTHNQADSVLTEQDVDNDGTTQTVNPIADP